MIHTSVNISSDGKETGALLREMLEDRGVYSKNGPAVVCYGLSTEKRPALNARCQSDKISRMKAMQAAGVGLVPWTDSISEASRMTFPLFGRKSRGMGGKDLVPIFQAEELPWRVAAGWTWFSSVVPIAQELRVWVWHGTILDTYEKVMQRPADYVALGRNFGQGFEFRPMDGVKIASREAIMAADALGLDFTAIDLLIGKDGAAYVLEANTAPGVIRSKAEGTLIKLADKIEEWCLADCPDHIGQYASRAEQRRVESLRGTR